MLSGVYMFLCARVGVCVCVAGGEILSPTNSSNLVKFYWICYYTLETPVEL